MCTQTEERSRFKLERKWKVWKEQKAWSFTELSGFEHSTLQHQEQEIQCNIRELENTTEEVSEKRSGERRKPRKKEKTEIAESKEGTSAETGRKGKEEGEKEEGMTESDRQKGREISGGTVTNKSLQHDRRLLKHFISPQHNGVLLPIICSVSARVDIKWGAAAFSCHFSAVSPLPWRSACFFDKPGCEQRGACMEGRQ